MHSFPTLAELPEAPVFSSASSPHSAPAFSVTGEAAAGVARFAAPPALWATGGALPPILVADDDEDDVFFVQRLIKKTGVPNPVRVFDDGSEVVNYLGGARLEAADGGKRCPRLLFLDLNMRGLGGFGFLEWARRQKGLSPLTIVVLSNSNEPETVARALALGAHRYLVKYPCVLTMTTIVRGVYPQTVF